jgi:subtilase family serine protease
MCRHVRTGSRERHNFIVHIPHTRRFAAIAAAGLASVSLAQVATSAHATAPTPSYRLSGGTPALVAKATRTGSARPAQKLHLAVWLKGRDQRGLDRQVRAIYTKGSAQYHNYLSAKQVKAAYAPSTKQVRSVKSFLTSHGFRIDSVAGNHAYINVTGKVSQAEKAFNVSIDRYRYHGRTIRSNSSDPRITAPAGRHIASISGLDNAARYRPSIKRLGGSPATNPASSTSPWDGVCGDFTTTRHVDFTDGTSRDLQGFIPCGYNGNQLQTAYGVNQIQTADGSLPGTGQTVAITDAYGSPTILQDANKFAQVAGLPALNSGNFQVVAPAGIGNKKESKAQDPLGWQAEVTIDVDAVHAMAPGAKIVLVVAPNNYASLDEAVNWVTINHIANIVTNSWGLPIDEAAPGQASRDERIFQTAAAQGIGVNFSSGDNGDETLQTGSKSVDFPASSPWVNAVGGTSLFLNSDNSYNTETGWGTTLLKLGSCASSSPDGVTLPNGTQQKHCNDLYDPSTRLDEGFQGGAGGGLSTIWNAQPWQSNAISGDNAAGFGTVGTHRAVPDVSMLADPYTGMAIWITDKSIGATSPVSEQYGGTSLASPLFAGIMADVDQARAAAGDGPAGLASQYLYGGSLVSSGAVHDVLPPSIPPFDANEAAPVNTYGDSAALFYGSFNSGSLFNLGFNADTSLDTATGWDDVTGVGSPDAPAFVNALK